MWEDEKSTLLGLSCDNAGISMCHSHMGAPYVGQRVDNSCDFEQRSIYTSVFSGSVFKASAVKISLS